MNTSQLTLLFTMISIGHPILTDNGTFLIDWSSSTSSCSDLIKSYFPIVNSSGYFKPSLQLTNVCKKDGTLMAINDCVNENLQKIEVLTYFFSLPENNTARQCECQSKCINIHRSSYTMKFIDNNTDSYFTTSNPCVAFCNKGYEIFLSSFALNSFPGYLGY